MNNPQVQHVVCFVVNFRNIFYKSFIKVGGCIVIIGINLKTLTVSTAQAFIYVVGMFVGFSGDINCNFLRKFDLRLERVFHSRHILDTVY